jgi:hypothetical protein
MADTAAVTDTAAAAPTPEGGKLGTAKPKLAKAKKVAEVKLDEQGNPIPKGKPVPRVSAFAGKVIYLNTANPEIGPEKKNPKRAGTKCHGAFALYTDGMKVEEFIEKGKTLRYTNKNGKDEAVGTMADIRWDVAHEYIVLKDA